MKNCYSVGLDKSGQLTIDYYDDNGMCETIIQTDPFQQRLVIPDNNGKVAFYTVGLPLTEDQYWSMIKRWMLFFESPSLKEKLKRRKADLQK